METVTVEANNYQIGKLAAMQQFHVLRRVAPVLASMGVSIIELAKRGEESMGDDDLLQLMSSASEVVSKMEDKEVEYVIFTCLGAVRREQLVAQGQSRYVPVLNGGRHLQFADISMDTMLRLTIEVLKENLSGFFPKLSGGSDTSSG
jgi:hypothetical protein